ncbi:lipopolysaccharide-induced tumor necrosis factor-alpha factor homolog [Lingula anatina]|uniref:Lipopolysaccharide-induced tumor necrosis factor-alpha factor homolog n=1 Tax=Lingula anatina TaxID=7574 RepID=A0A1S3IHU7_LINAN|nr:lipopolysaccharide-induced tumor necrosis factor-alpha factor homolog [Lingula anatina]|eukprot:XP_013397792.1 lipopolysaccharide-induced tumor necrosis factor-alpha factor homolog [Lingula anatina]
MSEKQNYGTNAPASGNYPAEPPPQYEPPKGAGYPPQQDGYAGYQQGTYPPQAAPVVAQPTTVVYVNAPAFGPNSKQMQCPYCQAHVTTSVEYYSGGATWLVAGITLFVGCWLGCCLIPFCIQDLKDARHFCPNCNRTLGTYHRM